MGVENKISVFVAEKLIELARRVHDKDYSALGLKEDPRSHDPHHLVRWLALDLFPVEGTPPEMRVRRSGSPNSDYDNIAETLEMLGNVSLQAQWEEEQRFGRYGLCLESSFSSSLKGVKSSLWKPEIEGEIELNEDGTFKELRVLATYSPEEGHDNVDYMGFIKALDGRVTQLSVDARECDIFPSDMRLRVDFNGYKGNHSKRSIDSYVRRELNGKLAKYPKILQCALRGFKGQWIRDVSFFDSADEGIMGGIYCVRTAVPKHKSSPYLVTRRGGHGENVALLLLSNLSDQNVEVATKFLKKYCFVEAK